MWQHVDVAKRPRDPNQLAKLIVDIATGEAEDAVSESKRHPEALRGRSGGIMGGKPKKAENHAAAVALHFVHYNFARVRKTLRITPAMAAGISDHVWSYGEIALLA